MARARHNGILLALASAILFGASTPLAKVLLGGISPWMLAGLLYLGVGAGLGIARILRRAGGIVQTEAPLRRADLGWLAAMILSGGIAGPVLLMVGLQGTAASTSALLLNLESLATLLIAWIVYRENVDLRIGVGAAAILAGAVILSWHGNTVSFRIDIGAVAIAGACLCWGIDNNLTRRLSTADPQLLAMIKGLVAGPVNIMLALAQGAALPDWPLAGAAMVVGFAGYGVSLVLFIHALRRLGAARTGAYFALAPFIGAVTAIVVFAETPSLPLVAAGLLMAVGLYLHLAERHEHAHRHEELLHEHAHHHDEHHRHEHTAEDPSGEPHVHWHRHLPMVHRHPHYPDIHHRHDH